MHIKLICQVIMVLVLPLIFFDLIMFDIGDDDSKSNSFKERGDWGPTQHKLNHVNDPLVVPGGPIIKAQAKGLKEALNGLV